MKITKEKYQKLKDMDLIDRSKYSLNDRVEMIVQEVQQLLQKYEDEARSIYYPEKYNKEDK